MRAAERHALVTGGGRGIGAAIAEALVRAGARVTLLARDRAELDAQVALLQRDGRAQAVVADVTDERAVTAAFATAADAFGPIEILVNNAGAARSVPFLKMTRADWDAMLAVNLTGTYLCSRIAAGPMVAAGWGRVVNVASTAGLGGGRYISAYCAAKHGVVGLTRALAVELAPNGVTVNAVCPGFVQTAMLDRARDNVARLTGRGAADALDLLLAGTRQRRVVEPHEVGGAVAWFCSDEAGAVTGQALAIDASGSDG